MRSSEQSRRLFARAQNSLAGGVGGNSRGLGAGFRPHPIYMTGGEGAWLEDVDGNKFIDYLSSFGALILGHRPEAVLAAVERTMRRMGSMLGTCHELEIETAERLVAAVPCWERVRFANTGSEAVMGALRLARASTGRPLILRFEGHYHGQADTIHFSSKPPLDGAGPVECPVPMPGTGGIPPIIGGTLLVRPWNRPDIVERTFAEFGHSIAAVICEPVMANAAIIEPAPGFLRYLGEITRVHGALLIFDEVKTGFRLALGGAQEYYGVVPDISIAAKAMGAGFPIAALGGRAEIFELLSRDRVVHSATYHTNPVSMAACLATIGELSKPGFYQSLNDRAERLRQGMQRAAAAAGVPARVAGVGSMLQIIFAEQSPCNYRDLVASVDREAHAVFWREMMERGVYFHPSQLEVWFVSQAHRASEIDMTVEAARGAFHTLARALPSRSPAPLRS